MTFTERRGTHHAGSRDAGAGTGAVRVIPGAGPIGAEVTGIDLAAPIDADRFAVLESALHTHGVLCFRRQTWTDEAQMRFSRLWGPDLDIHPLHQYAKPDHPEIFVLSNIRDAAGRPIGAPDAAQYWHTDLSYTTHPSRVSILYGVEIPHDDDGKPLGETEFACSIRAYEALPETMKRRLSGLHAAHLAQKPKPGGNFMKPLDDATQARLREAVHPVVRTHPFTGAKCLYVSFAFTTRIVELPPDESDALLAELFAFQTRPEFMHVHRWAPGDVLMWDNCSTIHQGVGNYNPRRRLVYRTIVKGSAPF